MANDLRRRLNRFKPREDVQWLDHEDRRRHRQTIKVMTDLAYVFERKQELTAEQKHFITQLTQSDNPDTWYNGAWNALDQTQLDFTKKLAEMAPYDLTAYHELMNPHEPPAPHHIWMCDYLMKVEAGEIMTLIITLPAGTAKSTYTSRSFAQWFMGRNPDKRVIAVGHSQKFVEDEFSKRNRAAIESDEYRLAFPDIELNPMEKAASFWRLAGWRGSYACRGAEQGVLGLRMNLLLGDDLFRNVADAMSPTIRDKIWRWVTADLLSRRLPGAPIIFVNTRYHTQDPPGKLIELNKEDPEAVPSPMVHLNLPAEAEEDDPMGREPGEWIWPEFYDSTHWINLKKTNTPAIWSAVYQGHPLDAQGEFVAQDDFKRFQRAPVNLPDKPIEYVKTILSADLPLKGQDRSDYSAILIFRKHIDGTHYLVHAWHGKRKLEDIVRVISTLMSEFGTNYALIEDSAMGAQIIENYQGKLPAPVVPYRPGPRKTKDFRFDAATPWITSGKILFPERAPWLTDFINELVAFPNGANDDYVDAFSQYTDHELKVRAGGTKKLTLR